MEIKAYSKFQRVSPKKARLICREFAGMKAPLALNKLKVQPHKVAKLIYKLVYSAVANAENNFHLKANDLVITKLTADKGPVYKRLWARSHGQSDQIKKPTSHLSVILSDEAKPVVAKPIEKIESKTPVTEQPKPEAKKSVAKTSTKVKTATKK
jgi:large subunit ribosomal protein L22